MQEPIQPITDRLQEARKRKSLSQRALSKKTGIAQGRLSRIERGAVDLRISSLLELARALDLEVMLVPRQLVPTISGLTRQTTAAGGELGAQEPRYRLDPEDDDA